MEHREGHREPAVRSTEQDGAWDFGAVVLELIEMWMPPATARQVVLADLPESVRHALGGAARIAAYPKILGLERSAALEEAERSLAHAWPSVYEPVPREVVEVPLPTREEEARRHGVGIARLLITARAGAALMDEACPLWPIAVRFQLKESRVKG